MFVFLPRVRLRALGLHYLSAIVVFGALRDEVCQEFEGFGVMLLLQQVYANFGSVTT
jgi:hypothetical protein